MKHIKPVTVARADALTDLWDAVWSAWLNFRFAKKNDYGV